MGYSSAVLLRATRRLEDENRKKQAEYQEALSQAYALRPRLREIDRALRRTAAQAVAVCFEKGEDPVAAIARLRKENLALQEERQWILDEAEIPEDSLDDSPLCSLCGGTGYRNGVMCECLRELCRQEQKRELAPLLTTGKERFEHFRLDVYPDRFYPAIGTTPRKLMQRNLSFCRRYAAEFRPGAKNLLFSGATGLGKTYLSACIARQVTDAGFGVVYVTAAKLFADYEAVKFDRLDASALESYETADLLILDDLGTEMTTPVVISSLYTLVNQRYLSHSSTIISTNLPTDKLEDRYNAQISSRLQGYYELIVFEGEDIRLKG